jgi:putative transcriptional regulator
MSNNSQRPSLFERLKTGLEEGIQFARGEQGLRTTVLPGPPPEFGARDVAQLRRRYHMSQREFAGILNVSAKTVQSWEQDIRRPSQAALRLLQLLRARPEVVCEVVGIPGPAASAHRVRARAEQ